MNAFLQDQGNIIIAAIIITLLTLIIGALLRPTFDVVGQKLRSGLSGLFSDFEKRYRACLLDEYRVMNVRGRKTNSPVSLELERVYVSLHTQLPGINAAETHRQVESLTISKAMQHDRRLVIIGGPGSGKTTLLHYLLLTYARHKAKERLDFSEKKLPVFIPLHQLKVVLQQAEKSLAHYLTHDYAQYDLAAPPGFFARKLKAGQCLVLLDGLDEVATPAERLQMTRWIEKQTAIYPANRFIVTSRPAGYEEAALNGFTRLDVQDFDQADIEQFCHNWCLATELAAYNENTPAVRQQANKAATDLIKAIAQNKAVRALAINPLQLSIIALVHRSGATLPQRRVELYAECVDVFLGRWDRAKGLARRLTENQKRAVLQPIALYMQQNNLRELDADTLNVYLADRLPAVGGRPDEVGEFLQEVKERSGLLLEKGLGVYAFSHLTFQEYLVARYLVENGQEEILLEHVGDEWWQEVTLLYTGLKDASPVVSSLLQVEDKEHKPLLLAGRCLIDAQSIDPTLKNDVIQHLENLFNTGAGQPFLDAGHVLAELEDEQALTRFLRVAGGNNEARRNAAFWALEQMLNSKNETQRQEYRNGFIQSVLLPNAGYIEAAMAVVMEVAAKKDVELSQLIVERLRDNQSWLAAANCLDHMMVKIPGMSVAIACYPVTNAQYQRFVEAKGYEQQQWWGKEGWQWRQGKPFYKSQKMDQPDYWQDDKWNKLDYPVVGVTWYEAEAYCRWLSDHIGREYRLLQEAEWQRAAQGDDNRNYPWGDEWREGLCNTSESGIGQTSPVGQFSPDGDSPIGCADMSGNVWEWCLDWHDKDQRSWVFRGGSWYDDRSYARCAHHSSISPFDSNYCFGFRVVSPI